MIAHVCSAGADLGERAALRVRARHLPAGVVAPAFQAAVGLDRARMVAARADHAPNRPRPTAWPPATAGDGSASTINAAATSSNGRSAPAAGGSQSDRNGRRKTTPTASPQPTSSRTALRRRIPPPRNRKALHTRHVQRQVASGPSHPTIPATPASTPIADAGASAPSRHRLPTHHHGVPASAGSFASVSSRRRRDPSTTTPHRAQRCCALRLSSRTRAATPPSTIPRAGDSHGSRSDVTVPTASRNKRASHATVGTAPTPCDEDEASGGARRRPAAPASVEGSSDALTARIHADRRPGVGSRAGELAAAFLVARIEVAPSERRPLFYARRWHWAAGAPLRRGAGSVRHPTPEEGSCPSCCSMPPVAVARRRRCPDSTPAARRATRDIRYPADPPTVEEIVAVMRAAGDARPRPPAARPDRRALARRPAHPRGARAQRVRPRPRRGALLVRRGKGGRRREVGMDDWAWEQLAALARGARSSSRSARCSASSTARPADGRGQPPRRAPSCAAPPRPPACVGASRRTSCATRTPSRWPTRACR